MKKIIITSLFLLGIISQNCFGQLKVDSLGRVGIGTTTTLSKLSVGGSDSNYYTYINTPSNKYGMYLKNFSTGLYIDNYHSNNNPIIGLFIDTHGNISNPYSKGIYLYTGASNYSNLGVCAVVPPIYLPDAKTAAIFGSSSLSSTMLHDGKFAGYFLGDVRITGTTYATVLTPASKGESSQITSFSERLTDKNISDKISKLNSVIINNKDESNKIEVSDADLALCEQSGFHVEKYIDPVQTHMSSTRYAIDDESLRSLFPELVYEDLDGNVSINYIEMVPLLVQSIKELNAKIESLEKIISTK